MEHGDITPSVPPWRYRHAMVSLKLLAPLLAVGAIAHGHSLFQSRQLWATVDICNPADSPNTIGIRGSMPSDGKPKDTMFMRFRVQYLNNATKQWTDLAQGADSGFLPVGSGSTRQAGRSFQFVPTPNTPEFTLRGVVSFQWRRGPVHVVHAVSRVTTTGHTSLAGADPAGFSAASCAIA
jgi:hypothetical protein